MPPPPPCSRPVRPGPVAPAGEEANHAAAPWVALAALRHAGAARRATALPVAPLHHAAAQAIRVDPLTLPRRGPGLTPRARNVALNCTDEPLVVLVVLLALLPSRNYSTVEQRSALL